MSKMRCKCGGVISDVIVPCPTEGHLVGDQDYERFDRDFTARVADFLAAVREGRRDAWFDEHLEACYPRDLSDAEVISDFLTWTRVAYTLSVAECSNCGRLHVQTAPDRNRYLSFAPDEPGFHGVLARKSGEARP